MSKKDIVGLQSVDWHENNEEKETNLSKKKQRLEIKDIGLI